MMAAPSRHPGPTPGPAPALFDCPGCHRGLDLSQPDPEAPTSLLGVCPQCGAWFRLDVVASRRAGIPEPRRSG